MKIRIYRNPDCVRCARISAVLKRLNWLRRADFSVQPPSSGALRLGEVVVEDLATGYILEGYAAFHTISRAIPAYLPLRILCVFPAVRGYFARQMSAGKWTEA